MTFCIVFYSEYGITWLVLKNNRKWGSNMKKIIWLVVFFLMISNVSFAAEGLQGGFGGDGEWDDIILEKGTSFTIQNITMEEFDSIFQVPTVENNDEKTTGIFSQSNRRDLHLPFSTPGAKIGTVVNGYFTVTVTYQIINFNGTNYDIFVSIIDTTTSLNSGSYTFHTMGTLFASITDGGARVRVSQQLGFEYATDQSLGASLNAQIWSLSSSTTSTYYYRTKTRTFDAAYTLPVINIIQ